ncbi:phosphonate ABC transporter, permease protein PhnE [Methylobacterium sp. ARG-1]|jgi:phosphonate transport system permease protein|uniref:phosphonate ABC transporter, permease protein PhnE n=1 Tax=Methylobacterium sp. ARG-1 TaxID=1692501 RepID=UPI00068375AE|nr:phosphonate ABC transporter, permease protein PhnE [Methylobacterium sp. ARG-1]KNY21783.1 phosphonate ABC transporter permease [Methylobacterium sp. ARG-1]
MSAVPQPADRSAAARIAFRPNWTARAGWLLLALYAVYAASQLGFAPERFATGLSHGRQFLARMFPPNFSRWELIQSGIVESVQIAVIATVIGIVIALPIGFLAARNLMPAWVTWPTRALIALCRSFHPIIVAILFVKAIGFGALAGVMALIVASVGFIAKLFAEAIEEISLKQVEAVRATGAGFLSTLIMGVQPQVLPRFIGFATYQLDSNLRNSTMVGIVGGGGIGATLFTAYQRFDYDVVLAILIVIVALIMVAEIVSGWARKVFQ